MHLRIEPSGCIRAVYDDAIDLRSLGELSIRRGSHVEPDETGGWLVDLSPVAGPMLGPFLKRQQAIEAEIAWLDRNWLTSIDN